MGILLSVESKKRHKMKVLLIFLATLALAHSLELLQAPDVPQEDPGWLTDLIEKFKCKIKGKCGDHLEVCKKAVEKGEIPSAKDNHSPIKQFGFPFFNEKSRSITLRPGVTLSYMFGHRQPIKLGSRDYVIAGFANELLAFFDCFKDYDIIGSSLAADGHWYPNTGSLKIQMQNLNTNSQGLNAQLWEMIFKISMDRIIKFLNPYEIIASRQALITGEKAIETLSELEKAITKIKSWLPGSEKFLRKLIELMNAEGEAKDKIKAFIEFWKEQEKIKDALRKQWVGLDYVNKENKIFVTLTMYAKPTNGVRTTYNMGKATMKVGEIGDAIRIFMKKDE